MSCPRNAQEPPVDLDIARPPKTTRHHRSVKGTPKLRRWASAGLIGLSHKHPRKVFSQRKASTAPVWSRCQDPFHMCTHPPCSCCRKFESPSGHGDRHFAVRNDIDCITETTSWLRSSVLINIVIHSCAGNRTAYGTSNCFKTLLIKMMKYL